MTWIIIGVLWCALGLTIRDVKRLSARVNEIEKRLVVAIAFASVARDIARRIDGAK